MSKLSLIKKNITANTLGGIWLLLIGMLSIPVQYRVLDLEVVGLLAFVATLQILFNIFEFGLSTTLLREISSDTTNNKSFSLKLIKTATSIYFLVATLLSVSLILSAEWIIEEWLTFEALAVQEALVIIYLLAVRLFVSWPIIFYSSILSGLQRLDIVNILNVLRSTLGDGGGIIILLLTGDVHFFIAWTVMINFLSLVMHIAACYRYFPSFSIVPKISIDVVVKVWKFSIQMNVITILALLYSQLGRLMTSGVLPIKSLSYYNGANSLSSQGLTTVQSFIGNAMLPALSEDFSHKRFESMQRRYRKYAALLMYVSTLPALIFVFFGYEVLSIWATTEVADAAYSVLIILSVAFLLNTISSVGFNLAVVTKNLKIPLLIGLIPLPLYIPLMYFLIVNYGIEGAAAAFLFRNIVNLSIFYFLSKDVWLIGSFFEWMREYVFPYIAIGLSVFFAISLSFSFFSNESFLLSVVEVFLSSILYLLLGFFSLGEGLKKDILEYFSVFLSRFKNFRFYF